MNINEVAVKYSEYQIKMRRYFHAHPEVSEKEFNTSKVIKEELDKIKVEWKPCGFETGVLATIKGKKEGKTILIRADMDALTVKEETKLPYASENEGVMHACGHDCHISMLLTAAHILNDMKEELCGTVKLAFQPAEETATGAKAMINDGALEGVDGCFGIHVWSDVESGKISCSVGPRMASADQFKIDITGKGGHGAAPHQCIDAAIATCAVVTNLQTIVSREVAPVDAAVVTVGTVQAGSRWNVIANYGHMEGTTRCFAKDVWDKMPEIIDRIAQNTAGTYRAKAKLDYIRLVPPLYNEKNMVSVVQEAAKKVIAPDVLKEEPPTTGGEDFAFFLEKVPGAIALLGVRNEECEAIWPQHSGKYCVDENALLYGAMLYAQVAMDFNSVNCNL
jgi:amidohydrolase